MSKTVTFVQDVYPYCVGDVVVLTDAEVAAVDKIAKTRKGRVYETGAKETVVSSDEADRQEANREADAVVEKEAKAKVELEEESADKDASQGLPPRSGRTVPGTSGDTKLKTAAAANKDN